MSNDVLHVARTPRRGGAAISTPDILCFSHLRWDFVYQRPQHLLSRFTKTRRVFFLEEPIFDSETPRVEVMQRHDNLWLVVPHLPAGTEHPRVVAFVSEVVKALLATHNVSDFVLWFYTPMALEYTTDLHPRAVVYDCMDELSAFKGAPAGLQDNEDRLFRRADVVFTGGRSLYEAKRLRHANVHAFPSSIDVAHFRQARGDCTEPADQRDIPGPRIGFAGVIDERTDLVLLEGLARARAEWQFVMLGPVVKIDPATLPRYDNIHYLGAKSYQDLPAYFRGWDVALIPFALNESTRFISPTKTPEYLAAGVPVVSTPIRDVVSPYGEQRLVQIASGAEFEFAIARALGIEPAARAQWLAAVDQHLAGISWDQTWAQMDALVLDAVMTNRTRSAGGKGSWTAAVAV